MKRLLLSGAMALAVAGPAYGLAPLMTDDFAYGAAAGNLTTLTANWVAHSGTSGFVGYQTSTLSLAGYTFGGTGGAATIAGAGAEDVSRSLGAAQTGDIYASALVNVSACGSGNYFFHFKNAGAGTDFRARVFAQDSTGNLRFGLTVNSGTGSYSTTNFSFGTTYLLVLRYSATTGVINLHVLTSVPAAEPAVPLLTATDPAPALTMESLAIRQGGATGPTAIIDGIRVGTTWADLLPVELMNFEIK